MLKVYGIKQCDTVKKALNWLKENGIEASLWDFRTDGITSDWLAEAERQFGWEQLTNKRSTTWRNLDSSLKENWSKTTALETLLAQPTLIKRPIILQEGIALIGFDAKSYAQSLGQLGGK